MQHTSLSDVNYCTDFNNGNTSNENTYSTQFHGRPPTASRFNDVASQQPGHVLNSVTDRMRLSSIKREVEIRNQSQRRPQRFHNAAADNSNRPIPVQQLMAKKEQRDYASYNASTNNSNSGNSIERLKGIRGPVRRPMMAQDGGGRHNIKANNHASNSSNSYQHHFRHKTSFSGNVLYDGCSAVKKCEASYDDRVRAFLEKTNSPPVKPVSSYDEQVSAFLEKNKRYLVKTNSELDNKPVKPDNKPVKPVILCHPDIAKRCDNSDRMSSSDVSANLVPSILKINIKEEKDTGHGDMKRTESTVELSNLPARVKPERARSGSPESTLATFAVGAPGTRVHKAVYPDSSSSSVRDDDSQIDTNRIIEEYNAETPGTRVHQPKIPFGDTDSESNTNLSENNTGLIEPPVDDIKKSFPLNVIASDTKISETAPLQDVDNKYHLNRSPSPERKYLHLIRNRSLSRSPERKFLEKINSRSRSPSRRKEERRIKRFRSRSPSPSSQSRRYNRRSRSVERGSKKYPNNEFRTKCSSRDSSSSNSTLGKTTAEKGQYYNRNRKYDSKLNDHKRTNRPSNQQISSSGSASNSRRGSGDEHHSGNVCSEREVLLLKYRKDFCSDINEMRRKINELSKLNIEELVKKETRMWTRMSPATLYYKQTDTPEIVEGTEKLDQLCKLFEDVLLKRAVRVRELQPKYEPPERRRKMKLAKHKSDHCSSSDSNSGSSSEEEDCTMEELDKKRKHPFRLHPELWFNDVGEMNDGPLCRCSAKARRSGIRHNIYAGELNLPKCDINSNNSNGLYHYRITISPPTNFLTKTPTIISYDDHEFIFEGFSMFSHTRLDKLPVCKVIRFNIEYTILYFEEKMPDNFTVRELDLFYDYLFKEILELVDLDFKAAGDKSRCAQFHFLPRFVRELPDNGKEILSMNEVLSYLLKSSEDLVKVEQLEWIQHMPQFEWQKQVDLIKGMVVTLPGMKPCALRVDQLDRDEVEGKTSLYPEIVHFGIRPPQLSYAGNPEYQKAWREYVKFRHLLANMPKPSFDDKRKLEVKETTLQEMRTRSKMKRDVTVTVSSEGFKKTGIMCDIVQHAMLIPVLVTHLRFHCSLSVLEETISYKFKNRFLLQLALTHPSYRENFGTNPDHARNSLTNCGIRQPEYGDRRIHYMNTRKRGINTLINIMSRFGKKTETESNITHNERLEFLGDAVVEFITSIHLFHMFPELEEGGLATYRAAIVQNQHLAVLAKTLKLDEFMLYAHGSDLCHDLELRHAMANCFEALMGALFLDGGIEVADQVFGETLFKDEPDLLEVWVNYPPHPLQEQEPLGDRKWIPRFRLLKNLTEFEDSIGIEFTHIRLLARAFTDRSIGFTNLTLGSNQRLEFLGDTVLQLIASEYLYKYFPEHHEGHLSLLRSSLVNNRTQAVVCNDLGMTKYALYHNPKAELKTKDRADLLEAFLGALYVDKGLEYCETFCNVCFFPRLQTFIMRQDWNDPKSKLQQCCLTLRTMEGGEPEIPIYKVIECMGPTNTRVYTVAVYFKGQRLAAASGHSIQQAEMNAAKKALQRSHGLFPQLDHQKRVIAKSLKSQHGSKDPHQQAKRSGKPSSYCNKSQLSVYYKKDPYFSKNGSSNYSKCSWRGTFKRSVSSSRSDS